MSSYFDEFDRKVAALKGTTDAEFLAGLIEMEQQMKRTCLEFSGDRDTPSDVRDLVVKCALRHEARVDHEADGGKGTMSSGAQDSLMMRRSKLSTEMHRVWHTIAGMRLKTRYMDPVNDNPRFVVERRNANAERKFGRRHE